MQDTSDETTENGRKRGAQPANSNSFRHGLRCGLSGGKLPKELSYVEKRRNAFRRNIEDIVKECRPKISRGQAVKIATAIKSACAWFEYSMKVQRYLREKGDVMSDADRLKYYEADPKAAEKIEGAIRRLDLDRDDADRLMQTLYTAVPPSEDLNGELADK